MYLCEQPLTIPPNLRLKSLNILKAKFKKETSLDASHANQTA